jgi:hypothetical protein
MTAMTAAALAAIIGAVALCFTVDALRWRQHDRAMRAFALAVALFAVAIAAVWAAMHFPHGFSTNHGFGPEWRCPNLGRGGAEVCVRDRSGLEAAARVERAAQDSPASMLQPLEPLAQPVELPASR